MRLNDPLPRRLRRLVHGGVPIGNGWRLRQPAPAWPAVHQPGQRAATATVGVCLHGHQRADQATDLALTWQRGGTEGGSSGSGVFVSIGARRLAGQLRGGSASAPGPMARTTTAADLSYRAALKQWLNP